jgi:hypothetical protein
MHHMTKPRMPKTESEQDTAPKPLSALTLAAVSTSAWLAFYRRFEAPFRHECTASGPEGAAFLLSSLTVHAFDDDRGVSVPVPRHVLYAEFTASLPGETELTREMADQVLDYLQSARMIVVDADTVCIHPRFQDTGDVDMPSLAEAAD